MQKIPLRLAEEGMSLARDVFRNDSPAGMPICGKGTVLTDALIARLEHLGVSSVFVEGHPLWTDDDKSLDDMLVELDARFEKVADDPLTSRLHVIYREYLKRSMGAGGGRQAE